MAGVGALHAQPIAPRTTAPAIRYTRQAFDPIDGIPDAVISAVEQTRDGFLWFGTRHGLVRFDGASYTRITSEEERALPSDVINNLSADPDGSLWVSTEKGLVHYQRGRFQRIDTTQVPAEPTWHVYRDPKGVLWVAGAFGVRYGGGTRFAPLAGATSFMYSLAADQRGQLWVAGREWLGVVRDTGGGQPVAIPVLRTEQPDGRFYELITDKGPGLWVATHNGALHLDTRNPNAPTVLTRITTGTARLNVPVWTLAIDGSNQLWLGTQSRGALRWDGATLHSEEPIGIQPRAVWTIRQDRQRNLWVGTSGGLILYRRTPFELFVDGMDVAPTWSIRIDRTGTRWAATNDGHVYRLNGRRWIPVFTPTSRNASSIWPSATEGLLIVSERGRILRATRAGVRDLTDSLGTRGLPVVALFEDTDRSTWLVTDRGLYHSVRGVTRPAFQQVGLSQRDKPHVILRDAQGRLLIGRPFLRMLQGTTVTAVGIAQGLTDSEVMALYPDGANLWIGTADSGLYVRRGDRVIALSHRIPALQGEVGGITADSSGHLWFTSNHGIVRIARTALERLADGRDSTLRVQLFERTEGLPSTEFNSEYQSQLAIDTDGSIWLPNFAGAIRLDPSAVQVDTVQPQVHIVHVDIDGQRYLNPDTVVLARHPGHVDVSFSITDVRVPVRTRVTYRIRGLDGEWQDLGNRRIIAFGPLRGGNYQVEIRVAKDNEPWSTQTALLTLQVRKTWYEQLWFYALAISALGGLLALFVRWRVHSVRQRATELESIVAARTAELEEERSLLEVRVAERTLELSQELETRSALERQLAAAHEMETVGRLAGGVAHEINNALTTVLGFTEMAQVETPPESPLAGDLQEVLRAGRRAADITRQLLAFARRQHTSLVSLQLEAVVQDLSRSMQQILRKDITTTVQCAPQLPPILADRSQMEQLIVNLVRNAQDAMPQGGTLTLRVEERTLDADRLVNDLPLVAGRYVTLAVSDTGDGIPDDVRPRLFEPFFTTKELNAGSGLGLPVCQGIVTRHHGVIEVDSTVGAGTTMTVWIPVAPDAPSPAVAGPSAVQGKECLLVVEDEAAIRRILVRTLTRLGYQVLDAEDGMAALTLLQDPAVHVDLIVTDVQMPRMSGLELARAARNAARPVPIVFMSGYAGLEEQALQELQALGPIVPKPFTQDAILQVIRAQLDTP
ncbi:MAG: two-component regulator propeller domain-containing protein [Gemmatimonadaceae bacterium]